MLLLGISINRLARDLHVPPNRICGIVRGTRSITADTALCLGTYFDVSPEHWLNLQAVYDLREARRISGHRIERTVRPRSAAWGRLPPGSRGRTEKRPLAGAQLSRISALPRHFQC